MIGNDNGGGDYDASGSPASAGDAGLHRTWSAKFFSQEDEMGETELMRDTESDQDFGLDKDGGTLHLWLAEQRCDPVYVTVSDARVEKIGFLKKSTTFAIKTEQQSLTQQVRRHFKDFVALRDGLELRFYGLIVPSLPPGGSISASDEGALFKRMYALQFFMDALCSNPFLRNDDLYTSFVSDPNPFDRSAAVRKPRYSVAAPRMPGEPPKASVGVRRWRQAVLSTPRVDNLQLLVKSASKEADVLIKGLKAMKNAARLYIGHIGQMADQSTSLAGKFGSWLDAEERVVCTLRETLKRATS